MYPAAGSHANFFDEALYLGSSAEQGVGCDDTRGPHVELEPKVVTIPSDPAAARDALPWIAFEGRWGELQEAFFNGPTGPNLKGSWTAPIAGSEGWRTQSYAVPTGGLFGTTATDVFCGAVAGGSRALVRLLRNPVPILLGLAAVLAVVALAATRTSWRPVAPLRVARRRTWGQVLSAAWRMYVEHVVLFVGIGLLFVPLALVLTLVESLVFGGFGLAGLDTSGESAGALALVGAAATTSLLLLGISLVQAATICALVRIDEGESIGPVEAYARALTRVGPLLAAVGIAAVAWIALTLTGFLIPVAIWLAARWSLLAQVVEVEGTSAVGALRRSSALVHGRWWRVASLVVIGTLIPLAAGPILGAVLILATDLPLGLSNIVAGVVLALALPFVALATSYVYFDARTRFELDELDEPAELPAEIALAP